MTERITDAQIGHTLAHLEIPQPFVANLIVDAGRVRQLGAKRIANFFEALREGHGAQLRQATEELALPSLARIIGHRAVDSLDHIGPNAVFAGWLGMGEQEVLTAEASMHHLSPDHSAYLSPLLAQSVQRAFEELR